MLRLAASALPWLFILLIQVSSVAQQQVLSRQAIYDITTDERGLTWIATDSGVYRLAGSVLSQVALPPELASELLSNSSFHLGTTGTIWLLTPQLAAAATTEIRSTRFQTSISLQNSTSPLTALSSTSNKLWLAASGLGLMYLGQEDETPESFQPANPLPFNLADVSIHQIFSINDSTLVLHFAGQGLYRCDLQDSRLALITNTSAAELGGIAAIAMLIDGSLVIAGSTGDLVHLPAGEARAEPLSHDLDIAAESTVLCSSSDGGFWINDSNGYLHRLSINAQECVKQQSIATADFIGTARVASLHNHPGGTLFIGTTSGLYTVNTAEKHSGAEITTLPGRSNATGNYVIDASASADGTIWFITAFGDLFSLTDAAIRLHPIANLDDALTSIEVVSDGNILLGTASSGVLLYRADSGAHEQFSLDGAVVDIVKSDDGRVYCITDSGEVWHKEQDAWQFSRIARTGIPLRSIQQVHASELYLLARDGSMLKIVSTAAKDEMEWGHLSVELNAAVNDFIADESGDLWLATNRGLYRYSQESGLLEPGDSDPLVRVNQIYSLTMSGRELWLGTERGLVRYSVEGNFASLVPLQTERHLSFISGVSLTVQERPFFGLESAYLRITPANPSQGGEHYPLQIARLNTPDESYGLEHKSVVPKEVNLEKGRASLTVDFLVPVAAHSSFGRIRYRLQRYDTAWNYTTSPEASWRHLPAGEYTLQAAVQRVDGGWTSPASLVAIRVHPPLWQRWQVVVSGALLVGFLALAGHRLRTRSIEMRRKELEREVNQRRQTEEELLANQQRLRQLTAEYALAEERERRRISLALHDQVGHELSLSQIKINEIAESGDLPTPLQHSLQSVGETLSKAITATRDLTVDVSPPALYEFGLAAAVENLLERLGNRYDMVTIFESSEARPDIELDVSITLYQVIRELAVNVIKHAQADVLKVSISPVDQEIVVRVRDNGRGFDVQAIQSSSGSKRGLGLYSIRERIQSLGGSIRIMSRQGEGTDITITLSQHIQREKQQ